MHHIIKHIIIPIISISYVFYGLFILIESISKNQTENSSHTPDILEKNELVLCLQVLELII